MAASQTGPRTPIRLAALTSSVSAPTTVTWKRERQDAHPATQGTAGRRNHRPARLQRDSTKSRIFPHGIRPNVSQSIGTALCLGNQVYERSADAHVTSADLGKLRCRLTVLSRSLCYALTSGSVRRGCAVAALSPLGVFRGRRSTIPVSMNWSAVQDRTASPAGSSIPRRIAKKSDLVCASADSAEAQMNAPVPPKDRACSAAEALAALHKGCG